MILGDKIGLRAIESHDLPQLLAWRNRPEFRRNFREFRELNEEKQKQWFTQLGDDSNTIMFSVMNGNGALIGACGLTYIRWQASVAELSLYIGEAGLYLDDVYATDAFRTLIHYAYDECGLNRLWVECYDYDEKRIALCKQFEFECDGVLRENAYHEGRYIHSAIYSLLYSRYLLNRPKALA